MPDVRTGNLCRKTAHALSCQRIAVGFSVLMAYLAVGKTGAESREVAEASGIRAYFCMVPAALVDQTILSHGTRRQVCGRDGPLPDAHHLLVALFAVRNGVRTCIGARCEAKLG
jgi:hypothetical protein